MITPEYVRTMAAYNRWQNENLYGTAEALSDEVRKLNAAPSSAPSTRTLNHLVWADQMWMSRFRRHTAAERGRHSELDSACTRAGRT